MVMIGSGDNYYDNYISLDCDNITPEANLIERLGQMKWRKVLQSFVTVFLFIFWEVVILLQLFEYWIMNFIINL